MKPKKYKLETVFTPSQPAVFTFVDRESVNKRLDRGLNTPGKQIIIYGHSGAGKTTLLLNKFKTKKIKSITTRCVIGMTLRDIVIDAFNQLEVFYEAMGQKNESGSIKGTISAAYFGIKSSITGKLGFSETITTKRAVELPITPQALVKFLGISGNCWVIEDFHKINSKDKVQLAQIMKVFMDSSIDYPKLKIIAIGAVNSAREVVQFDPEMKSRITEIEVPLMSDVDLIKILEVGESLLNIKFSDQINKNIIRFSNGLPSITHQLALLLCESNDIKSTHQSVSRFKINAKYFDNALDEYLAENSDTLKSNFEIATKVKRRRKSENPDDILKAILTIDKEEVTFQDVKDILLLENKEYKGTNLKKHIDELTTPGRGEILRFNKDSMTYSFSNPFIKVYSQVTLRKDIDTTISHNTLLKEFRKTIDTELEVAKIAYLKDIEEMEELF